MGLVGVGAFVPIAEDLTLLGDDLPDEGHENFAAFFGGVEPVKALLAMGAHPDARYILLQGLWETLVSCMRMMAISSVLQCTQCTAITSGPRNPISLRNCVSFIP